MNRMILFLIVPLLAACATPREACLRTAVNDFFVVDRLIAETQANLQRGYSLQREAYTTTQVDLCVGSGRYGYGRGGFGWRYCSTPTTSYRQVPTTIDRPTEQRKLKDLQKTRTRLVRETKPKLAYCNAKYPQ